MLIGKTSKNLSKLIQLKASFCVGKALLDPYKHTTMSHSVHNMFVDLYPIGVYPEIIQVQSIPARTYQPFVVSTCVEIFNTAYGTSLTSEEFLSKSEKTLSKFIQKDLKSTHSPKEVLTPILEHLGSRLFVRESRWTWTREQKTRLSASKQFFFPQYKPFLAEQGKQYYTETAQTVGDFLQGYNALIQRLVLSSTFSMAPQIPQAATPLEKHYVEEYQNSQYEGVQELNNLQGEQDNFINKALGYLHRI